MVASSKFTKRASRKRSSARLTRTVTARGLRVPSQIVTPSTRSPLCTHRLCHPTTRCSSVSAPRSRRVAMSSAVSAYGVRQYQQKLVLEDGHTQGITAVAFSRDGVYLATAGLDGRVCIWNTDDGKLLHMYKGSSPVLSLAWVPSGEEALLFGTRDGNIGLLTVSLALVRQRTFMQMLTDDVAFTE